MKKPDYGPELALILMMPSVIAGISRRKFFRDLEINNLKIGLCSRFKIETLSEKFELLEKIDNLGSYKNQSLDLGSKLPDERLTVVVFSGLEATNLVREAANKFKSEVAIINPKPNQVCSLENLLYISESTAEAKQQIEIWFKPEELIGLEHANSQVLSARQARLNFFKLVSP